MERLTQSQLVAFARTFSLVDWELLHKQKFILIDAMGQYRGNSRIHQGILGVLNLLDALQDDAESAGLWTDPANANGD